VTTTAPPKKFQMKKVRYFHLDAAGHDGRKGADEGHEAGK